MSRERTTRLFSTIQGTSPDGRTLRRYRKRWKVERTFAWLQNFRRLLVRQDRFISIYLGFFHLACALISLRYS
jgi:transposase